MITKIFNAKNYYNLIITELLKKSKKIYTEYNKLPHLAILVIGNNFSKNLYIKNKITACLKTSIKFIIFKFTQNIKHLSIILLIKILNNNTLINAIIIQMPIAAKFKKSMFNKITIKKDIDMLNPQTFGSYILNHKKNINSCTSLSILKILKISKIKIKGLIIAIFGFSNIVGKPITFDLFSKGATVISINKNTKNITNIIKNADIIIVAVGKINFLSIYKIAPGAVIIDVGINNLKENIITGDLKTYNFLNKTSYITPVPGGIGPLTIVELLNKVIKIFKKQNGRSII